MSNAARFFRPLLVLAALLLVFAPVAFATDAKLLVDASIYDVKLPDKPPSNVGASLAFDGTAIQVHLLGAGKGTLPNVNLGWAGDDVAVPRTRMSDNVNLSQAIGLSTKLSSMPGGVVVEHRNTNMAAVKLAYTNAFADLGFAFDSARSTHCCWHFTQGANTVRVNATGAGKHVVAYVGR